MYKEYYFQGKYKEKELEMLNKLRKTLVVFAETENYDNYNNMEIYERTLIKDNLYKKVTRKDGTISKIIEKLKELGAVKDEMSLNYIRYMLLVLEFRINNSINENNRSKLALSEIFNEDTILDIFLGEEWERDSYHSEYCKELTLFRKAIENICVDIKLGDKKITSIIKEEIDYLKKVSCFSTLYQAIPKNDMIYKDLLYENSIHKSSKIKENLLSHPFLAMYFLLLRMELKSYINRTIFILEQIKNQDYKKLKNRNSRLTINLNDNTIHINKIREYLVNNIEAIAKIIYEKENCTRQEKEYLIDSYKKIKKYNEIMRNTSLEVYIKNINLENRIYISFIIPILREIVLTEKGIFIDKIMISKKNKSRETSKSNNYISMKNVLNKEIDKITYEETIYLHFKLQRSASYYSDEYSTFKNFFEIQNENLKMIQYMIGKLNSVGALQEMSDELIKLIHKK